MEAYNLSLFDVAVQNVSKKAKREFEVGFELLGDKIDKIIDETPEATYEWWDKVHKMRHIIECAKWLAAQRFSDGKRREMKEWGEYIWQFAACEEFMTEVSYEYHMEAMKELELDMVIGN